MDDLVKIATQTRNYVIILCQ